MRLLLAVTALSAALGGCRNDYVRVNDMALGRVVIYRNGVAYYERRATLSKDSLTIQVPRDKVNDFLKSLTVRDARTGRTLPVGFPSPGAEYGGLVNMVIDLPPRTATDLIITYITGPARSACKAGPSSTTRPVRTGRRSGSESARARRSPSAMTCGACGRSSARP